MWNDHVETWSYAVGMKARKTRRLYRPVTVKWVDACARDLGWYSEIEPYPKGGIVITTRGFMICETRNTVIVASSVDESAQLSKVVNFADPLQVPRGCVISIRYGK